jgi:hypothetical protein
MACSGTAFIYIYTHRNRAHSEVSDLVASCMPQLILRCKLQKYCSVGRTVLTIACWCNKDVIESGLYLHCGVTHSATDCLLVILRAGIATSAYPKHIMAIFMQGTKEC